MFSIKQVLIMPTSEELSSFVSKNGYSNLGNPFWRDSSFKLEYEYELIGYLKGVPHKLFVHRLLGRWNIRKSRNISHYSRREVKQLEAGITPPLFSKNYMEANSERFKRQLVKAH